MKQLSRFICFFLLGLSHTLFCFGQSDTVDTLVTVPLGPSSIEEVSDPIDILRTNPALEESLLPETETTNKSTQETSGEMQQMLDDALAAKEEKYDSQEEYQPVIKKRYFGVNAAPLLANLVPFNEARDLRLGSYNMAFYRIKDRGGEGPDRMFRFGLGVNIEEEFNDRSHINLRIGSARVFQFKKKWRHYRGLDVRAFAGSFNLPESIGSESAGIGLAPLYGLEYEVLPGFTISTETSLFVGVINQDFFGEFAVRYFPPFSLFLNVNFK